MKKLVVSTAALSAALLAAQGQQSIWQMDIGFPGYTGLEAVETLTDFPALVTFTDDMDEGGFFNTYPFASEHGWDLRFFGANNAPLDYEIDTFDPPNIVQVWVRLPSLTPDGLTSIRAEWGDPLNALAPEPCTFNGAVWVNHLLVHHYNNTNTTEIADAAGSAWVAGILAPEPDIANQYANGVIGKAVNLSRSYGVNSAQIGHDNGLLVRTVDKSDLGIPVGNAWTISAWFKDLKVSGVANQGFWRTLARGTEAHHHVIVHESSDALGLHQVNFFQAGTATLFPSFPGWRHITAVGRCSDPLANPPVGTTEMYVDGVFVGAINRVVINDIKGIGGFQGTHSANPYPNPNQQFADYLDEFRVAGVARSAAWIWADHQTQSSAPEFASYTSPIPADDRFIVRPATAVFAESAVFNGWMRVGAAADVTVFWATNGVVASRAELGPQNTGTLSCAMEPLLPRTEYACWFRATNSVFEALSNTNTFTTTPQPLLYWGGYTTDVETGISSNRVYTHALDFGNTSNNPLVEGVRFTSVNTADGTLNGYGWKGFQDRSAAGSENNIKSDPNSGICQVLKSLRYFDQYGTLLLTGLEPGREYEMRFFIRSWGVALNPNEKRMVRLTFYPGGMDPGYPADSTGWFNEDEEYAGSLLHDRFIAYRYTVGQTGELTITFESETSETTFHIYGISNEKILPVTAFVTGFTDITADLRAALLLDNAMSGLTAHWGEVDARDGSEIPWQGFAPATASPAGQPFHDATAFGLSPDSTYYFRFSVTTPHGVAWSEAGTFTTYSTLPIIGTLPATDVSWTQATAWCDVLWPGISGITDLVVYYGLSNGADNEGLWQAAATNANVASAGAQSKTLAGLLPNTTYWCRWRADSEWAPTSVSFTTPPALVPQTPSDVACTNATLNCSVEYAGTASAAQVTLWYGTVNGGTNPSAWQASASATAGVGNHAQAVGGLLPATLYHYCWQIDGAWYGGGVFTTFPSIELLAPTGVGWSAATLNCRVWYAGPSGASNLVLYYGTADRGKDAKLWTEFTPVTIFGATPGEHAATLSGLASTATYHYRWFTAGAWSEAGVFSTVPWEGGGIGNTWYWTGESDPPNNNVSDVNNWRLNNDAGRHPDTIDEIFRCTLWFWGPQVPTHLNQDIDPLVINIFRIGAGYGGTNTDQFLYNNLSITNKPIILLDRYDEVTWYSERGQPTYHVQFYNDLFVNAAGGPFGHCYPVTFHGTMSEFNGSKVFATSGWGNLAHFRGPVLFTGGFANGVNFYGMHTTGVTPAVYKPNYFNASQGFHIPHGETSYDYGFPPEKGFNSGTQFRLGANVTVAVNAPLIGGNTIMVEGNSPNSVLEFNAPYNSLTGGIFINNSSTLVILRGATAAGTPGTSLPHNGALDLNGEDMEGRDLYVQWHEQRVFSDGILRNQNPDRESLFNAGITKFGYVNGGHQIGGVGDLRITGDISGENVSRGLFSKVGTGTLTLGGTSFFDTNFGIHGGSVVLDYSVKNTRKLGGAGRNLTLSGGLELRGGREADAFEAVNHVSVGQHEPNGARITVSGDGGRSAAFAFNSLDIVWQNQSTLDFADANNGRILASPALANNARINALDPRATYNGATFARVSETQDPQHPDYYPITGLPGSAYESVLDPWWCSQNGNTAWNIFLDVPAGYLLIPPVGSWLDATRVAMVRFNAPGAARVEIGSYFYVTGTSTDNDNGNGAILVTSNVGLGEVSIDGPGSLETMNNNAFTFHQYNTAAQLVVNAAIIGNNKQLLKAGPGKLLLTHPGSNFERPGVFEGVLAFTSIADAGVNSSLGKNAQIMLGNATLRFEGDAPQSSNRQIQLRGNGTLDASGTAPVTFTRGDFVVVPNGWELGQTKMLTLSGDAGGVGMIEGNMNLGGGRLRKQGPGAWVIAPASASSFIWGTDVLAGTLTLDGFLGRDVTVKTGGTIAGAGQVQRHLYIEDGATLSLDPAKGPLTIGKNLSLAPGAILQLPRRIPSEWKPILVVNGEIKGEIPEKQDNAYFKVEGNTVYTRFRPRGTLVILR